MHNAQMLKSCCGSQIVEVDNAEVPSDDVPEKILFAGPKELCELNVQRVTAEGELADGPFEIAASGSTSSAETPAGPSSEEKERMTRLISIEERVAHSTETVGRIHRLVANNEQRLIRLERMLTGIDQRLPAVQGDLEFRYATAESVASLRKTHMNPLNFARHLETEVFKDCADELGQRLDERHSRERVNFIRECVYKFYNVPAVLRDDMWRGVKAALNARARKVRKNKNDRTPLVSREEEPGPSEESNDAFEFHE
ncbi:unnamed protein product [Nippostrongylus brasiliensis]|uniref:DUF4806 domain-containing protein n=1 Tax=Nippostrongylus brasiliensis TaxID=27835 RepID=A0A0N4YIN6_NIPBR|nr:unnamed protein product [Nippostrongylus brasiliensis]